MNAQEFLRMTSPDDNFGLRADLQKHTLRRMVEKEMEMYAEYKLKEVKAFEMLEMLEYILESQGSEFGLPQDVNEDIIKLIKEATEI